MGVRSLFFGFFYHSKKKPKNKDLTPFLLALVIPLPSPQQQWVRVRSEHFVTLSAAGERRTREIVRELETVALALRQIDPRFAAPPEPTRMIVMAKTRDVAPYFERLIGRNKSAGA